MEPELWDFCGDAARGNQRLREAMDGSAEVQNSDSLLHCIP
jgi:hypothetical protein